MATRYNGGGIPAAAGSEEQLQKSPILIHERITTPSISVRGIKWQPSIAWDIRENTIWIQSGILAYLETIASKCAYAKDATTYIFVCAARENTQNLDAQNLKKGEIKDFYPDTLMQKTCFNIPLLDNLLSNYLDKQFVEYLIRGPKEGFNTGKKVEQSSL